MDASHLNRWLSTLYKVIGFAFICPAVICIGIGLGSALIKSLPPVPTPLPINLTLLPLPDAVITPGPVVTPDWDNQDSYATRGLNSQVVLYTNRFGLQWFADERFNLGVRVIDGRYNDRLPAYVHQGGAVDGRLWGYSIVFPWPLEPFTGQRVYTIDGATDSGSGTTLARDATGPAAAEFLEANPNPPGLYDGPLARCRHHVHGQITLTSYSPVVGNFQFACQFDATEYALVSGWFWE